LSVEGLTIQEMLDELSATIKRLIVIDPVVADFTDALDSESIEVNYSEMRIDTTLRLILGPHDLAFVPGNKYLVITTRGEALQNSKYLQLRAYDCRDLLSISAGNHTNGISPLSTSYISELSSLPRKRGGFFGGGGDSKASATSAEEATSEASHLKSKTTTNSIREIEFLVMMVQKHNGSWEESDGEGGSISAYNGNLIIRQTEAVHQQIEDFLNLLRRPYTSQGTVAGISLEPEKE